jgi:hypothetical protein
MAGTIGLLGTGSVQGRCEAVLGEGFRADVAAAAVILVADPPGDAGLPA